MCSIWRTLPLVLDVQPRRPCITSFWVWFADVFGPPRGCCDTKALVLSCFKPVAEWVRNVDSISQTCFVFSTRRNLKVVCEMPLPRIILSGGLPNILDVYCHGIEASFWLWPLGSRKWRSTWWAMSLIYSGPTTSQDDEISFRPHWQVHQL